MKKEKGFTLIELLAVIVILSIVLIISVPKILDVIQEVEKKSFGESANLIGEAARLKYTTSGLTQQLGNETYIYENNKLTADSPELKYSGDRPKSGIIKQEKGKISFALISKNGKYCAIKKKSEKVSKVYTIKDYFKKEDCTIDYVNKLKYYINFDANHGHTDITNKRVTYQEAYGELPEAIREKHIFEGWYTEKIGGQRIEETTIVTNDKEHTLYAHWEEQKYTVTFKNDDGTVLQTETLSVGEIPEYKGVTPTKAETAQFTYTFNGWNRAIEAVLEDTEYVATYTNTTRNYTVTFKNGENIYSTQTVVYSSNTTKPSTNPSKEGYIFKYWSESENGSEYNFNTLITSNITLYAVYEEENLAALGVICKRATSLHTETCSDGGCTSQYNVGNTITYGNYGTKGTLTSGDAFDCDVNGDGTYNSSNERFYYVSDYYNTSTNQFESDTAVLIYYNNTVSGVANNKVLQDPAHQYYSLYMIGGKPSYLNAGEYLPTTSQWSNVSLKNTSREILNEANANAGRLNPGGYPSGYAARILTIQELKKSCSVEIPPNVLDSRVINNCNYLSENTQYSSQAESTLADGYWLETASSKNITAGYVISGKDSVISHILYAYYNGRDKTPEMGIRPVIEVPKSKIRY